MNKEIKAKEAYKSLLIRTSRKYNRFDSRYGNRYEKLWSRIRKIDGEINKLREIDSRKHEESCPDISRMR